MAEKSEFGRGLLTCLIAFLDHKSQVQSHFDPDLFSDDRAARLWANGASDHLYELLIPVRLQGTPLAARIEAFKEKWLSIGHGFEFRTFATKEDVLGALHECERMALEVAAELDKALGLDDAEVGKWT